MSALPRYRRPPLAREGVVTARKRPARRLVLAAVARRAKGRCEIPDCGRAQDPLDGHHAFRRSSIAGIPAEVCETPELILGVCRPCHDAMHAGDQELTDRARWLAIERFVALHELWDSPKEWAEADPVDVMRELVRQVEQRAEAAGG